MGVRTGPPGSHALGFPGPVSTALSVLRTLFTAVTSDCSAACGSGRRARTGHAGGAALSSSLVSIFVGSYLPGIPTTAPGSTPLRSRCAHCLDGLKIKPLTRARTQVGSRSRRPAKWHRYLSCPTQFTANDIQYRLNKSKATVFVGDEASMKKFAAVRSRCPSVRVALKVGGSALTDDIFSSYSRLKDVVLNVTAPSISLPWNAPALIYFTSGTSCPPKMVLHNQASYPLGKNRPGTLPRLGHTDWSPASAITAKYWHRLKPGHLFWNTPDQGMRPRACRSLEREQ